MIFVQNDVHLYTKIASPDLRGLKTSFFLSVKYPFKLFHPSILKSYVIWTHMLLVMFHYVPVPNIMLFGPMLSVMFHYVPVPNIMLFGLICC